MNQKLINYVKQSQTRGLSRKQIVAGLKKSGWQANQIEEAFQSLNAKTSSPATQIGSRLAATFLPHINPLFFVLFIALLGFSMATGYFIGEERGRQTGSQGQSTEDVLEQYTLLPKSIFFGKWWSPIFGTVAEVTPQSITLESGVNTLSLPLVAGTLQVSRKFRDEGENLVDAEVGLSLSDIGVGDSVIVNVSANTKGDLTAESIGILPEGGLEVF